MLASFVQRARFAVATAVVLSVPGFALWSLASTGTASAVEVARADDPIRNGLRIVDAPVASAPAAQQLTARDDADEVLVTNWSFTNKGTPSPYQ